MLAENRNQYRKIHYKYRKQSFCVLLLLLISCDGIAQVPITQTDIQSMWHGGQVLKTYTVSGAANIDIGKTGGPNIYDFSSLSYGSPEELNVLNVSQIPDLAARFPDSAIVLGDSLKSVVDSPIMLFVPDTLFQIGRTRRNSANTVRYGHEIIYIPMYGRFPLQFGSSFSYTEAICETTYANGFLQSVMGTSARVSDAVFDGFGTLRIPGHEFQCLRFRTESRSTRVNGKRFWYLTRDGCLFTIDADTDQPDTGQISVSQYQYMLPSSVVGVKEQSQLPAVPYLHQNYPNPFNPITTISYQLPTQSHVTLKVFDVLGRELATLVNDIEQPGYKSVNLDAGRLASGVYYYRLDAASLSDPSKHSSHTKKMLLIK